MSFMSDKIIKLKDAQYTTESSFLASNLTNDRRYFWKNSLYLLQKFIYKKHPGVIGLQEINKTPKGSNTGSDAIDNMLQTYYPKYYHLCVEKNTYDTKKVALSIIYDTSLFGKLKTYKIINNPFQPQRLLLMAITSKDYLFVNFHGAKDEKLLYNKEAFNKILVNYNINFIQNNLEDFMKNYNISERKVLIIGDTNDFYDRIHYFTIFGKKLKYKGTPPKSCCYNWKSSCTKDRYMSFDNKSGICSYPNKRYIRNIDGLKLPMYGEEGFTKNYRFYGDKIFGLKPISKIKIFQGKNKDGVSIESDHQLVYAKFEL
jgi:hypothetical protein